MALSSSKLQTALAKLLDSSNPSFVGYPANLAAAAQNFANAYAAYAGDGQDAAGNALLASNSAGFASALASLAPNSTTVQCANQFAAGFASFWAAATFSPLASPASGIGGTGLFSKSTSSAVTVVVTTTLLAGLTTLFAAPSTSGGIKAGQLATLLDTATKSSITVLITGLDTTPAGSGGPLPITNTGNVS